MNNGVIIQIEIEPVGKPRQSQKDKWLDPPRPAVARYRAFCDELRRQWPAQIPVPEANAHLIFSIPMPRSWSKKKKAAMVGKPHRQARPDVDNLHKAFMDAMLKDDSSVWDARITKRWDYAGSIVVETEAMIPPGMFLAMNFLKCWR